jgi:hypothetical protein
MSHEFRVDTAVACDDGVRTLYRYMSYPALSDTTERARNRREWVERLLSHHEIYFPLTSQFNDPFETSPQFRILRRDDGSIDTDTYIDALRRVYGPKTGWSAERIAQGEADLLERVRSGVFEAETAMAEAKWVSRFRTHLPMCSVRLRVVRPHRDVVATAGQAAHGPRSARR